MSRVRLTRRRVVGGLLAVITCGLLAVVVSAPTAARAPEITKLPTGGQIFGYDLGADAHGAATVVWSTARYVDDTADSLIRVSQQNSDGTWTRPQQLGGLNQSLNPTVAESASGAAAIVWSYVQGGPGQRTVVEAVTRSSADATWSRPRTLWSIGVADGALATVGIDDAGVATVVWSVYGKPDAAIWSARVSADDGRATVPRELFAAGAGGTDVRLVVNGSGAALLCWQRQLKLVHRGNRLGTVHAAEMAAYRTDAGRWLPAHRLSSFTFPQEPVGTEVWVPDSPTAALSANGTAVTTWTAAAYSPASQFVAARNPVTGRWSAHALAKDASALAVGIGPRNSLVALWSFDRSGVESSTSTDGVHWSMPTRLPLSPALSDPTFAAGTGVPLAIAGTAPHLRVLFTVATVAGRWSRIRLAGTGALPEIVASANGTVTVAWEQKQTSGGPLETRSYR